MGTEIERKFLVKSSEWRAQAGPGVPIMQGYLSAGPPLAVRVRIADGAASLNIKKAALSISRDEFEYSIPTDDAALIMGYLCEGHVIEKTRYEVVLGGTKWEVDVFAGANKGLVVAEVELDHEDQSVEPPPWVGEEVSGDPRYLNAELSRFPFSEW